MEDIRSFARQLDGYTDIWIDRPHNGWVTVGFVDADVEGYQRRLAAEFPDAGVVAVTMPFSTEELNAGTWAATDERTRLGVCGGVR